MYDIEILFLSTYIYSVENSIQILLISRAISCYSVWSQKLRRWIYSTIRLLQLHFIVLLFRKLNLKLGGGVIYRTHTVRNACKYFVDSVVVGIITAQ